MEREIKNYKRNFGEKEPYDKKFKKQLNVNNFLKNENYFLSYNEKNIKEKNIKKRSISKRICKLPKEIQHKIYIMSMRFYWRNIFMNTKLRPMWCDYKKYLDNEIKKCTIDNVHFMHLDFNTLKENKKWIPGCGCEFCQTYKNNHVNEVQSTLTNILNDPSYFLTDCINCYELIPNKWNMHMIYYGSPTDYTKFTIFDSLADMFENQIKDDPHESPIYFSEEIMNMYPPSGV